MEVVHPEVSPHNFNLAVRKLNYFVLICDSE